MIAESGGETHPGTAVDLVESMRPELLSSDGRVVPAASLILVIRFRAVGIPLDPEALDLIATFTGVTVEAIAEVVKFRDLALSTDAADAGDMTLCRGTSCTLYGASTVHSRLKEGLESEGMQRSYREVHCLDRCEHGPSAMVGRTIYCARAQTVIEDERDWRQDAAGPIAIDDDSVPVRD